MSHTSSVPDTGAARRAGADAGERQRTLDLLRGLAISGVIAIHVGQQFPSGLRPLDVLFASGWVGVNIFYLVSGWTMCLMWVQRAGEQHPIRNFYIRRLLRIAPLFWLAIPIYLAARGTGPGPNAPFGVGPVQILLTSFLLHGLWPDSINSVVPGDWSIAAEVLFYAAFPFVILAFGAARRRYLYLAIGVFLFNVCVFKPHAQAFFLSYYGDANALFVKTALHLGFLTQFPIFLVSAFLFFGRRQGFSKADAAVIAIWVALGWFTERVFGSNEWHYLLINLTLAALVYGVLWLGARWRLLETLGRYSYSMYLFHFLVIDLLARVLPLPAGPASLLVAAALTTLGAFAIALATQKTIEGPARALARKLTRSGRWVPSSAKSAAVLGV